MADAPPLPVREHRTEFLAYVSEHDVAPVGTFYSAYPSLTVLDILGTGRRGQLSVSATEALGEGTQYPPRWI